MRSSPSIKSETEDVKQNDQQRNTINERAQREHITKTTYCYPINQAIPSIKLLLPSRYNDFVECGCTVDVKNNSIKNKLINWDDCNNKIINENGKNISVGCRNAEYTANINLLCEGIGNTNTRMKIFKIVQPPVLDIVNPNSDGVATVPHTCLYDENSHLNTRFNKDIPANKNSTIVGTNQIITNPLTRSLRQRKTVVYYRNFYEPKESEKATARPQSNVEKLVRMYSAMIQHQQQETQRNRDFCVGGYESVKYEIADKFTNKTYSDKSDYSDDKMCTEKCINKDQHMQQYNSIIPSVVNGIESNCASFVASAMDLSDLKYNKKKSNKIAVNDNYRLLPNMGNVSPISDEGCQTNISPYSSCSEDDVTVASEEMKPPLNNDENAREKVNRSTSSDSAVGLEDDILPNMDKISNQKRRNTLTVTNIPLRPALLPVPEPKNLLDSPKSISPSPNTNMLLYGEKVPLIVPSKTILEAQIIELPSFNDKINSPSLSDNNTPSRRESSQSYLSDITSEENRVRYVRTPSVVVSDYSDDVMCSITLDDIEFFQNNRRFSHRGSLTDIDPDFDISDISASSSCSNLNYCGSSISVLESMDYFSNQVRQPERKLSDCSTCSTASGDDDDQLTTNNKPEQKVIAGEQLKPKKPSGWRKLRNIVQWTPFFQTYKKQRYPWVQLAGHQGNFKAGPDQGTVLKKMCPKEELCFNVLMKDVLRPYVPEYKGQVTSDDGELYLQLQDLLSDFVEPCVMDCKIGVRTYLEEELSKAKEKPKLRKDMYEKMIQIDSDAPNEEEHRAKGVTKPRYMVWRETISSTATLGFRIEGIKKGDGTSSKDFKTTKSRDQIVSAFNDFITGFPNALPKYIQRLKAIRATLECSDFFTTHEVIGSSLLFVHDKRQASIWLIDFAKTVSLPENLKIEHNRQWSVGNHEDGYLIGINNLIEIFEEVLYSMNDCITNCSDVERVGKVPKIISTQCMEGNIHNNNVEKLQHFSLN